MLAMKRFTVRPEVIAAGLSRTRITPIEAAAVRSIPPPPDPTMTLRQAGLETSDGIVPEFAAALAALAAPTTIVSVTTNRAGRSSFRTANFIRGAADRRVVMQARTADGQLDLVVTPTVTEATVLMDQLLDVTAFPGGAAGDWNLSLRGYARAAGDERCPAGSADGGAARAAPCQGAACVDARCPGGSAASRYRRQRHQVGSHCRAGHHASRAATRTRADGRRAW